MNRVANRRVQAAGLGDHVALMLADPTRLPFENGRFDALFMRFTLEVLEPTERGINVLRVGRRVLRPGGRLVIVSLSDRDDAAATSRAYAWARSALPGLVDCRPISAASMLATAGLTVGTELRLTTWGLPVDVVRATR
jgi:ubiquinone/menaquinone biosynthesis C-methylase UbiE